MSEHVIEANGLVKRYGAFTAVDGLDLTVRAGEVFGVLGPNGSGKTTTILMILGLTEVTEGSVKVVGLDPTRDPLGVKKIVGYMPDTVGFYDHLSARDNLKYTARLADIPSDEIDERIDAALRQVRLLDVAEKRASTFSRGMRQRLGLAEILIKRPRLAILDEPTSGLDPHSAHEFLELISELKSDGISVVLSSHLLERVQAVCDRVALFYRGQIVLQGTVSDLAQQVLGSGYRIFVDAPGPDLTQALKSVEGATLVENLGEGRYLIEASKDLRPEVPACVGNAGGKLLELTLTQPSLDEVYNRYFEEQKDAA